MTTVNIPGVELVKAGTWASARGKVTITNADLAAMVAESRDPDLDAPPIKLGHVDPRFDGEPALGWVRNLRLSSDGATLIGDLTDVPASLADVIATAYPRRSIEAAWGMPKGDGTKRGAVLTGLALLGITPPAVKGLADVYRAAAAGEAVVTVMFGDTPDVHADQGDTPDPDSAEQHPATEPEDHMSDTTPAPEGTDPVTEPEGTEPVAEVTPEPEAEPVVAAVSGATPQVVTLSQGQYDDLLAGATAGAAAKAALDGQRRDGIVNAALSEGRLRPADTQPWREALDRDEAGTVALLSTLPQVFPVAALGSAHAPQGNPNDAEWTAFEASLTGKGA